MTPRYLDVAGTAAYLSLTESAVRSMVARHDIPVYKVGRRLRFSVTDLEHWMRKQRVEAT